MDLEVFFVVVFGVANSVSLNFECHLPVASECGQTFVQCCYSAVRLAFDQKFDDIELLGEGFFLNLHPGCLSNELHVVVQEIVYLGNLVPRYLHSQGCLILI